MTKYYALYKGDDIITIGTKIQLALYLGVREKTIEYYTTPIYYKRIKGKKNSIYCVKIEEEEENE